MTLLGNKNKRYEYYDDSNYHIPKVFQKDRSSISLKKSIILSMILHPAVVFFAWFFVFIMALLGINFVLFNPPEPKMKDIEFVLVDKEATPINKNTRFRADKNSRAGGLNDPKRRISAPSNPSPKVKPQQKSGGSAPPKRTVVPKKSANQEMFEKLMKQRKVQKQAPRRGNPTAKPSETPPMVPKPIPKAGNPRVSPKPSTPFAVPVPKSNYPNTATSSQGPISGSRTGTGSRASGSGSSGAYKPSPSLSPSGVGTGSGKGGSGRFSSGYSSGSGSAGNPSPGNPKGAPGIDALREPDFGPYMRDLQRRIKSNWDPPSGNESKRVVLLFKISKDGRLISVRVSKSSGLASADRAAVSAVELSAPFRALPPEYRQASVEINFTFDYNVLSGAVN